MSDLRSRDKEPEVLLAILREPEEQRLVSEAKTRGQLHRLRVRDSRKEPLRIGLCPDCHGEFAPGLLQL